MNGYNPGAAIFRRRTGMFRTPRAGAMAPGFPRARGYKKGSGNVLSAKQRQALPRSSFALPGKGKGPKGAGAGSYPIPDISHARNALARVSQHGSPAEKATVRRKVHAKFPQIGQG